ncbi:hypothetical protein NDN08_003879 [Rhodosorus marinus]|uniref:N(4)-(Beta-N-acetylglucosaminyl)-L-asparaginase n=1 Tax=Rhodosorus marinus TaxID=101924 RepID=A0AAV8UKQ7_9RHOD|nr:hypothetical protein NDN08_003879 [Rhodosorus marinus]
MLPSVVSTWDFSKRGVETAGELLKSGVGSAEAVEEGVRVLELDESVPTVGYGGLPNIEGVMQLDAGFMNGDGRCGAVMALEGYRTAVGIARRVMDRSRHTVLAGEGAKKFAMSMGFQPEPPENLLNEYAVRRVKEEQQGLNRAEGPVHTDTVGFICIDEVGDLNVACTTSGMQFKDPGRIGDSPIIGAGLFADKSVGAATATGDGDQMIRFCLSFLVVELMRMGKNPTEACNIAIDRVLESDPDCQAAVTAMDMEGVTGSAATRSGFVTYEWTNASGLQRRTHDHPERPSWRRKCI